MNLPMWAQNPTIALLWVSVLFTACSHAQTVGTSTAAPPRHFVALDVFGSDRITESDVRNFKNPSFKECVDYHLQMDGDASEVCQRDLIARIQQTYHFAYARFSFIDYYSDGQPIYATLDVVEPQDRDLRMKYTPRPHGQFRDPGGLLKAWDDYQKLGFELLRRGELSAIPETCGAFHCIFGHDHPALAPYREIFTQGVRKHQYTLENILLEDANDLHRSNAAFLLAYMPKGRRLIGLLSQRIYDESPLVRNNVMRVFGYLALQHSDLELPLPKVLNALNLPETTDRNKVTFTLLGLVSHPDGLRKYRSRILSESGRILLRMLRLQQPNNHDIAYQLLRLLSGQDFGERNYDAWEQWYGGSGQINR